MTPQNDPKLQDSRSQADQKSLTRTGNEPHRRESSLGYSPRSGYGYLQRRGESPFGFASLDPFRGNPFSFMRRMTEEMDRLFQDVNLGMEGREGGQGLGLQGRGGREGIAWSPAIEVAQNEGKLTVQCELPGVDAKDVKVEITNDALILQGERRAEREENERGIHRSERQYGSFYRAIPLPDGADTEHATARCQNGLLEVTIPVPQQREERRSIPIDTSGTQATSQTGQTTTQAADARRQAA
jgi:HSP20 family protein